MRVLIIKDEKLSKDIVERILIEEGYAIDHTYEIEEGVYFAENAAYDLIIVNVCYSREEAIDICRAIRSKMIGTPILVLTYKSDVRDRVNWLNAGVDGIFTYPFTVEELKAKIDNLLRREGLSKSTVLRSGDLVINTEMMEVYRGRKRIELNKKEYLILEYLMYNPNIVITRTMIQDHIWGIEYDSESNLVDVYVRRLRKKLNGSKSSLIQTVRGVGYRLKA